MSRLALFAIAALISLTAVVVFGGACSASKTSAPASPPAGSAAPAKDAGLPVGGHAETKVAPAGDVILSPRTRNFVCERLALENSKAPCEPELTDAGELHTHTARITLDGQVIVCALNSSQVSAVCGPMFTAPQAPPPVAKYTAPKPPAPKAPAKK